MKTYGYKKGYYAVSILGPNIMIAALLLYAIFDRLAGNNSWIDQLAILMGPLLLFSGLVVANQPRQITDDGETLTFYGFFQKHEYKWSEINYVRIRKFSMTDKIFIRIGRERVLKGRYWLDMSSLSGSQELLEKLIPLDPQYERYNVPRKRVKKK